MTHVIPFHPLNTRFITFVVSILKYSPSKFKNSLFFFNVTFDHCTVHLFFFFYFPYSNFVKRILFIKFEIPVFVNILYVVEYARRSNLFKKRNKQLFIVFFFLMFDCHNFHTTIFFLTSWSRDDLCLRAPECFWINS